MPTVAELIQAYLIDMLASSPNGIIEIRRTDLATVFNCVPSQINYVLGTRFTTEHGFHIETRRGGGGFIRISRIDLDNAQILELMQECTSFNSLQVFVERLYKEGFLTKRETYLVKELINSGTPASHILKVLAVLSQGGVV
jgi:transcriptional regulator CtsR